VLELTEEGESARRAPLEVGETWPSESLTELSWRCPRKASHQLTFKTWMRQESEIGHKCQQACSSQGRPDGVGVDLATHRVRLPLSSVLRRDGAARRDPCGATLEVLLAAPAKLGSDGVVGVRGSGFTVMLDLPLSVLEPVMELKRELSSGRGIVTACKQRPACETKQRFSGRGPLHARSRGAEAFSGHCRYR
jgi:hypothetical protein